MIIGAAEEFINRETNRMKQTKPNENKKQNETNQTFRRGRTHAMHNISNVFSILIIWLASILIICCLLFVCVARFYFRF